MSDNIAAARNIDWKRMGFLFLGIVLFAGVYWSPAWPDAVDPNGKAFALSPAQRRHRGLFVGRRLVGF